MRARIQSSITTVVGGAAGAVRFPILSSLLPLRMIDRSFGVPFVGKGALRLIHTYITHRYLLRRWCRYILIIYAQP